MSLLVRARKAQIDRDISSAAGEKGGSAVSTKEYTMSDSAMMDQVVRPRLLSTIWDRVLTDPFAMQLTFLGEGHETTASGLA